MPGEGVVVVAPLVEALVLRALRRRAAAVPAPVPTRLVGERHVVDSLGYVAERTSVLLRRPGRGLEVLGEGRLVLPALLGTHPATYVVVTHEPVEVWLRIGPFDTRDDRTVQQVELRLTVALEGSLSVLRELAEESDAAGAAGGDDPEAVARTLLDRLAREVADRTTEAVRGRTLAELTSLSVAVLLGTSLPTTFLGGLLARSALEVVDVDWPTEGRGWPRPAPVPVPGLGSPGPS